MNSLSIVRAILAVTLTSLILANVAKAGPINMLVANRGAGTFSAIDINTKTVTTYNLPGMTPEPMYITHSPINDRVYIGDRANNRLVVYDANDYNTHLGFVDVGAGIFHQWGNTVQNQLWVNNDIDDTISVVDMLTSTVITTIPVPGDLTSGKPHDVVLDPNADFAYVTMLGVTGVNDYVLKYNTNTFMEVDRLAVGKDPHVALSAQNDLLYVPTQGSNTVNVINRTTFTIADTIAVPNSHGAFVSGDAATFFTTNIADGGTNGLISIDTAMNTINSATNTPFSIPHNIRISPDQSELYLTHSGANSEVTLWDISNPASPVFSQTFVTGLNPYGIELVHTRGPLFVSEPASLALLLFGGLVLALKGRKKTV